MGSINSAEGYVLKDKGIFYKYNIKEINGDNIQFACINCFCCATGILSTKGKSFKKIGRHTK